MIKKQYHFITDRNFTADLLQTILPSEITENSIILSAGSYTAAIDVVSTLLSKAVPASLICEIKNSETDLLEKRKNEIEKIYALYGKKTPFYYAIYTPSIEILFCKTLELAQKISQKEISIIDFEFSRYQPTAFLHKLSEFMLSQTQIINNIDLEAKKILLQDIQLQRIIQHYEKNSKIIEDI